jgi:hypothetical protein
VVCVLRGVDDDTDSRTRGSAANEAGLVAWRAARSTAVIGAVAVTVAAAREGDFRWGAIVRLAEALRPLLAMIFLGLLVWEFWFRGARRRADDE